MPLFKNVNQGLSTKGSTGLYTAQELEELGKKAQNPITDYGNDALNTRYRTTVKALYNLQQKTGSDFDVVDDAKALMSTYINTVRASYQLYNGAEGKDYLKIGDNDFQRALQDTINKYQYGNKTTDEYEKLLKDRGYQTVGQQKTQTEQNVIGLAKKLGAGASQEERALAAYYDALANSTSINNRDAIGIGARHNNAVMGTGEENQKTGISIDERDSLRNQAQALKNKDKITLEDAEKYLGGQGWEYGFAKDHPGDLTGIIDTFRNGTGLIADVLNKRGETALNNDQKAVYDQFLKEAGEKNLVENNIYQMNNEEKQRFAAWGQEKAAELERANGLYIRQQPDKETQYILDQYRKTPAGAMAWEQDAKGTDEEQQAKDNLYFVERQAKYNAIPITDGYVDDSQGKAGYSSGNTKLDWYYQVINNIGGKRDTEEFQVAERGEGSAALDFYHNTDEREKGIFNALVNRGENEAALDYLEYMQYAVNERIRERTEERMYNLANGSVLGSVVAGAASVPADMMRFLGAADIYAQNLRNLIVGEQGYRPVDVNTSLQLPGAVSEAADKGITEKYDWKVHLFDRDYDAFDMLYGTLKSGATSYASGALSRGLGFSAKTASKIAGLWLGSNAAQGTMQDIAERGGDNAQVLIGGTLAGVFESLFESLSIEKLFKDIDTPGYRTALERWKNIGKEALTNFSEEFNTEAADIIMDYMVMGDLSDIKQKYNEYYRLTQNEADAKSMVWRDMVDQAMEAGLSGALMGAGFGEIANVSNNIAANKFNQDIGNTILENDWGQALGQQAQEAGIHNKTAQKLSENALDAQKKRNQRKAGALYEQWFKETENSKAAREAAQAMLTQNRGEIVKSGKDAQEAVDTGVKLAKTAQISEDGENRYVPKVQAPVTIKGPENGNKPAGKGKVTAGEKGKEADWQGNTEGTQAENAGDAVEIIGVGVKEGKINIKIRKDGELTYVPYEDVRFANPETAEKAAVAALVGGEEMGNSLYNAQEPGTKVPFIEFAKKFAAAYNAAKSGADLGAIRAAGMGEGLTDGELRTAVQLGQANKQIEEILGEAKNRAIAFVKNAIAETVKDDAQAVAEAVVAREAGEELTDEQQAMLDKYEDILEIEQAAEALTDEAPVFGAEEARQLGLSGRRFEEVESTLRDMGMEVTDEIRQAYEQGQAELAARETKRINDVKAWNAGQDGSRVGVVRSIQPEEAEAAGVRTIQGPYNKHLRDSITALRGLAESTGVNMVLFESPIKEGEHAGANGWYDSKTRTVYLDVYSGKGNEQALLRTASHELTHFIKDWSPALYKKYRDFLLDHYYGSDNNAIKRLTQEQMDKDSTLDLPGAMDEVVADASEMMLEGDEDATKALAEKHPSLFVRIRGWIDTWAKALRRAWKGLSPTNEASRMLKASAEKFSEAQRMWWEALEDASINLRGEIKQAEIEADREAKIQELRQKSAEVKERAEKRRQEAIERANAAQTAEEGQAAIQEAQQAQALSEAQEKETKQQEKKINQEAKKKEAEAKKVTKAGERIEKKLARMHQAARDAVKAYAEEHGIALDGSAQAGTALVKEAMHYYNQGAYGWPFNANTDAGKGELADFAQRMNAFGQEAYQQAQLEAAAEPATEAATTEENVAAPAEETGNAEENVAAPMEETVNAEEEAAEPEKTLEEIAGEAEAKAEPEEEFLDWDPAKVKEKLAEYEALEAQGINPLQDMEDQAMAQYQAMEEQMADEEPTPEESAALEQQQQTAQKMGDVLKGMSKKAQNLVMKWGANEWVNVRMEDGSAQGIAFAQWAKKWYDAGRAGDSILHVEQTEEEMTAYPPFLQDEFYNAGKADAAAQEKAKQRKEKKKNEKPADQGTKTAIGDSGNRTGRLLEEVPAENVQEQGGGRDAVSEPAVPEQRNGGNDAGPDEPGTVRERGEGVRERDHVRPATGEVNEEAEAAEEAQEQLQEAVEEEDTRLEAETPKGTNYVIGDSLGLHRSTEAKAQYKDNVAAIRLLRQLEAENRYATKEEQDILSKYVGWGGLANVFSESDPKWKKEYAELAELLTPDEYEAARASTTSAFYTGIDVIRAMYAGLEHLGFQGGRMLEPSGGIGHFIGAMPADMQQSVKSWTMVELDSITGRIAAKLYPNADVRVQGFEAAKIGNNVMDVAIGNVPFDVTIYDPAYKDSSLAKSHNYFFAKAIDKVRPGGIVMFLTSSGTMDAYTPGAREYMAQKADLIGAVRLPNTTFKENAGTEVVADILIFKKREDGTPYRGESFRNSTYFNVNGDYTQINEYFAKHPEMILGTPTMVTTQHGRKMTIVPKGTNLGQQITEAIGRIEAKMDYSKTAPSVEELQKRAEKARANTKENGFEVKDGKIYQNQNGELKAVEMKEADAQKVKDMLAIRDTARALQELQKQGADKKAIAEKRKELNKLYDAFTQKNGLLHNPKNAKLIEADPDHFFILALENYDKKAKTATKADIFSKDTIAAVVTVDHADTPQDAIAVVLNEKGYLALKRAAELLGVTEEDAQAAMINSGLAFLTENGTLETREKYLSGDVRAKLRQAEALATVDDRYQRNVDELKKVIPEDVTRENIYVKPGATWIPESVYEQFICDTLKEFNTRWRQNVKVTYIPASGEYTLELSSSAKRDYRNTQEWGTNRKTFAELLDALMNNRTINVYNRTEDGKSLLDEAATLAAREKAEKIQQRFREWLWENEERAKALEKLYNDKYNAIVVPEYDGSGLTIAGANAAKQLRPHQKNVVHRIIQNGGNTLIAHCVGAGKTAEMAGAAMKLRQLGIVQKPVFVVPKALVGQWGREFLDFFPAAKILVLSENDFNAKNRKEFSNRIATGDYDAIIMSREQFGKLPMTEEYQKQFYQETINQITQAMDDEKRKGSGKGMSVKNMEKAKKRLEAKLKSLETKKKDVDNINFEDMGIDSIFVDEAHEYKNLMFTSNMNNISGLGNKEGSQRAFDMYMKTKYLRSINGGRGIVFATATPVMNSMSEMYIMQKYLQEDKLNQLGITSFDAWANLFGEVMTVIEPTPSGKGFRQKEAFARFKNLPELQRLFRSFADVMQMQGLQDIMRKNGQEIKIPKMKGGKRITIECEPGEFQLAYIDQLAERAEKLRHGNVDPKVDNMLKITSEGRKLSYTQRMIDPSLPYEEGSKILKCVENVEQIYKESKANKGTQLIFCDMATPKGSATIDTEGPQDMTEDAESVDFYGDIKRMLTAKGIPANEIAFIHDADTNEKRNKLFEDVNEGRVRVLIGSTGKMGVGMNAQKRIVALHHLDAPWRPGDIEQREGRAIRQKNMNDEVGIYVYVTKRTFDTRMWDNLYRKANFINQIMNGTNTAREVEGDGDFALSAAEIKAIATGDPMIVEQFEVNNQIKKLESLEREWQKDKKRAREQIQLNTARIGAYEANLPKAEADMKTAAALDMDKNFVMKIDGKRYTERAKANAPLLEAVKKHEGIVSEKKIGEIGGFTLYADGKGSIVIKGAGTYSVNVNFDSDTGTMTRVLNQIKGIQENADRMKAAIEQLKEENRSAEERMNQPFDKAEELEQLRARAEEIANILNPVEDQAGAANLDETEGTEEEEKPEKKVKYSKRATDEQTVNMTTDRIDAAIKEYGAKFSTNYSKAYMTYISPEDFLSLTTSDTGKIVNESRKLNVAELQDERQTPFIDFDQQTGAVTGHEGRHRMAALKNAGVEKVAILVKPDGSEGRYDRKTLDNLTVSGQDFGFAKATGTVTLSNLIPVNESHRQELIDTYGESENKFQYSTRNPDDLSDRQLLARAYEGIAKTDYERRKLEEYKGLIAQLDADTEELARLRKQIHDKTFIAGQVDRVGALKLREQADALAKKIAKTDKTLLNMQRSAALKGVLEVEKKEAQKKIREKIKGQMDRYNEGVTRREYAERIKKTSERLAKWIVQPDKNNHVPKALRQSVARFLLTIQQGTSAEFKGQGGQRRERNFLANMRELQGIVSDISSYQMQSADERVQGDFGMYIDLPDGFTEQMADLIRSVEKTMQDAGTDFNVNAMTGEQMKTLYQVLSTISSSITHANDLLAMNTFRHVDQAAQNSVQFIRDQGKVEYWRGGNVHNFLNWENMQPVRAFERFGEGGEAIFKALTIGQGTLARNVVEILKYTDPEYAVKNKDGTTTQIYSGKEAKEWSEQIKTFDVGGKKISMPVADVMSLYCLLKRGQAVGHIFGEGFRVADFKDKRGKLIAGSGVTITQDEAKQITDTLTARQKRVADKMQNLMSTLGSKWGNYVSMKRFGYEMFTEKNYFPIEVDSDRLMAKTDESKGNELYRLLNLSSVKPITPNAKNRIMIKNIFDVFSSHMTDMAQYNALALPILDAVKWINYREKTSLDDGSVMAEGIREAAREMYGNKAGRYIIELLKDLNGTQALGDFGEEFSKKMLMRMNRQAVAANLSVAMKQPTSIIRAAMELGGLDLIRGAIGNQGLYKRNVNEMLEHSGIALWKDLGFYDVNVSRPVKNMVMQSDTAVDKLLDKATWLPEKADKITWAAIWGACKAWVQRNGGTFATTEEYWQAVTDKFEDVIYKTQVVDSLLTRSQFMRGTSLANKILSSFMSEPTTTYNMLLEAMYRMQNDMRKGLNFGQAFAKHHKIIMRTTAVYIASAAIMTLLEAFIGAWRDDDDYETFLEKFQNGIINNAIDEFNPLNNLPIVGDIMEYGKKLLADYVLPDEWNVYSYAGGENPLYNALDTAMGAVDIGAKLLSGNNGYTLYGLIYKGTNALSQGFGVPVAPAMRDVVAIWNTVIVPFAPEMRIETYESTEKQGAAALYKAITEGDKDREALLRRQLAANNADQKKVDSKLKELIKQDEENGKISEKTAEKYLKDIAGLDANEAWKQVQKWGYEAENDDNYTEYKLLDKAVISGTGIQQAMKDLTTHGKTEKEVQEHVRSVISEQTGKERKMTPTTAERLLRQYGGLDADAAWIRAQELTYQARTGTATTSDIAMVKYAIEKHQSPKEALDGLLAHGKEKKNIVSSITSAYKEQYLQLRTSNPSQAATLKGQLISIYDYLGYNGKKKVEDWEKKQK